MAELLIGSSGWDYAHPVDKGGWVGLFYPNSHTARLQYYSQFFPTVEIDATFYDSAYSKMTKRTFYDMVKAVPSNFEFSIRVPENITHIKRLDSRRHATVAFQNFLDKISPLKDANKLGAILLQLPSSFLGDEFKHIDGFLDKLPAGYDYAMEFHNLSWQIEGCWKILRPYNVAAVMTDSPDVQPKDITNIPMTADHVLIMLRGRTKGSNHNYFYNEEQLRSLADKINQLRRDPEARILRIYFNNHYGAKAIANAIRLKELLGEKISEKEKKAVQKISDAINRFKTEKQFLDFSEA